MTSSRSLSDADPWLAETVLLLQEEFSRRFAPFSLLITCVRRSQLVHDALWLQGRSDAKTINAARLRAGMPPLTSEKEIRSEVTWTRSTKHCAVPFALAVDLAVSVDPDGPEGPLKPVIEWNDIPRYEAMGVIAKKLGLVWGGDWRKPDYCHVEKPRFSGAQREE
ncbi:MAG: M15 family metallopeptidase [Holophagales bacterium]|nr:M15 family metallopeptidase [Holophagales bacterium]